MTRRCSHCGHNGHNSRTCTDNGVKIFGVRLHENPDMKKSLSAGNLVQYESSSGGGVVDQMETGSGKEEDLSDGGTQTPVSARERKKGVPWTEEEHRLFLIGLNKLGKGDWRGISRNFVLTRTPTQVASHAQKYFIRQSNLNKRKRRSSLFDISSESVGKDSDSMLRSASSPSLPSLAENKQYAGEHGHCQSTLPFTFTHPPFSDHLQSSVKQHSPFAGQSPFDLSRSRSYPSVSQIFLGPHQVGSTILGRPSSMPLIRTGSSSEEKLGPLFQERTPERETEEPEEHESPPLRPKYFHPPPLEPWLSHKIGYEMMMMRFQQEVSQTVATPCGRVDEGGATAPQKGREDRPNTYGFGVTPGHFSAGGPYLPSVNYPFHAYPWQHPGHFPNYKWSPYGLTFNDPAPKVIRPTAVLPTAPIIISEEGLSCAEEENLELKTPASPATSLTLKLFDGPSHSSAFHPSLPASPSKSPPDSADNLPISVV